jgi:chemotaxis family two-component system response regulator Rcp1
MADPAKQPIHVFLAEDNRADVYLIEMALREHGLRFELLSLSDGETAIERFEKFGHNEPCPDIALIDQNLPRQDGNHVIIRIRAHPDCGSIPIIILSSSETRREREMAEQYQAVFFRKTSSLPGFMELGALVKRLVTAPGECVCPT